MVVGAAPARWTTAGMKREDGMQGSRSEAVDERGRSLVMDNGVGVSAPAWWRRAAVDCPLWDGGRRGFAAGGEVVLAPTEYEWGIGRVGGTMFRSGTRLFLAFLNRRWDALV